MAFDFAQLIPIPVFATDLAGRAVHFEINDRYRMEEGYLQGIAVFDSLSDALARNGLKEEIRNSLSNIPHDPWTPFKEGAPLEHMLYNAQVSSKNHTIPSYFLLMKQGEFDQGSRYAEGVPFLKNELDVIIGFAGNYKVPERDSFVLYGFGSKPLTQRYKELAIHQELSMK